MVLNINNKVQLMAISIPCKRQYKLHTFKIMRAVIYQTELGESPYQFQRVLPLLFV